MGMARRVREVTGTRRLVRDADRRDLERPRYFISIAAELASVHPRTLRIY